MYFSGLREYAWWYFFFFNDTATTEIYTLSLHDALPILPLPSIAVCHKVSNVFELHAAFLKKPESSRRKLDLSLF